MCRENVLSSRIMKKLFEIAILKFMKEYADAEGIREDHLRIFAVSKDYAKFFNNDAWQ